MKHLIIVFTLTIVVLISSVAVFFVEDITTPIIDDYNFEQANKAKFEVLPALTSDDDITPEADYDFTGTTISELIIVEGKGYIYTASFQGFQSIITYIVGIDEDGNLTGYKTLLQGDTPGLGAEIANPDFYTQFVGLSTVDAGNGEFDGLSGSTITTGGLIGSLNKLIEFHSIEFQGVVVETPEEKLLRYKEEITEVGATFTDVTTDYDLTGYPITKVETTDNHVIYTAEAAGYTALQGDGTPDIIYLIAFDLNTNDIIGFRVITHAETPIYGGVIETEDFQAQFDDLAQDAIDDIAGTTATITLGGLKVSLEEIVIFHQDAFEGTTPETNAEKLLRYKREITVDGAIITDVSGDFDLTETNILSVEYANDGTEDVAVIYKAEFVGFNSQDFVEYLIAFDLETNDIIGLRIIYQNESPGYGAEIANDDYNVQFDDMAQLDALNGDIDGVSGATVTTDAFKVSLNDSVRFHQAEFQGIITESDLERFERLLTEIFPTWTSYEDVTRDHVADHDISVVYDMYEDGTLIGVIYLVDTPGAGIAMPETYIQFLIGVNLNNQVAGFRMIDDNDTSSYSAPFYLEPYEDSYDGDSVQNPLDIDSVAGSTKTNEKVEAAVILIYNYHMDSYLQRPDSVNTASANLELAFPGAISFVSVYEDYAYNSNIYNIYEALDMSDDVIGYVYYGHADGIGEIEFAWGVDLTGTTQAIAILNNTETWEDAHNSEWSAYDGSEGYWPDTTWLDNFEGVTFTTVLDTQIDGVAGVSITKDGIREVLEIIAQYHSDESVGGAG